MVLKRTVTLEGATAQSTAKRLKQLEGAVKRNRSEMHHQTYQLAATVGAIATGVPGFETTYITQLSQGDDINNRSGLKVRVWRVEVRGFCSHPVHLYLTQNHGGTAPTGSSFQQTPGSFIDDTETNTLFTEWKYYKNPNHTQTTGDAPVRFTQAFKKGIIVKYNGSNSYPVDNGLHLSALNTSAAAATVAVSIRVWFTHE